MWSMFNYFSSSAMVAAAAAPVRLVPLLAAAVAVAYMHLFRCERAGQTMMAI